MEGSHTTWKEIRLLRFRLCLSVRVSVHLVPTQPVCWWLWNHLRSTLGLGWLHLYGTPAESLVVSHCIPRPFTRQTDLLVEVLELTSSRLTPIHFIIKLSKAKARERLLKVARKKRLIHIHGNPHKTISRFFISNFTGQKGVVWYIQNPERKKKKNLPIRNTLSDKVLLHDWRRDKEFSRQIKAEDKFITLRLAFKKLLKGVLQAETKTLFSSRKTKQRYNSSVKVNI